jgi:LuxR family maltose regulon positive regulatory protein
VEPPYPAAILTSLINDLLTPAGDFGKTTHAREMVLVLDDYHVISNPEAHATVTFLLEHCPGALHLVIASRSDPPLPLARLRARGQLAELRAADLSFTGQEAGRFLNEAMDLGLDTAAVAVLEERTEGWAAGLQMAALSLRSRSDVAGFIAGFSGTNRFILDYLLEEILAGQPEEIVQFLLYTSILDRLCGPLCDALWAGERWPGTGSRAEVELPVDPRSAIRDSRSILDYLETSNLFLVPLDDERAWFRYHQLFTDLLRTRLEQTQPGLIPQLHERASVWLEQHGLIPEAVQHCLAAGEIDRAAGLIQRYGPARWAESDLSVIRLADRLAPAVLLAWPSIALYRAWLHILQGHTAEAHLLLKNMAEHIPAAGPDSAWIHTLIAVGLAFLSRRSDPAGLAPLPAVEDLEAIPAGEPILRDAADALYAMTLGRRGEFERAEELSLRCIRREKNPLGALSAVPNLVPFLASIYILQGRLHAAASLCRQYLDPIRAQGNRFVYIAGIVNIVLGDVLCEWNFLDEAEQQIRAGLRANEPWQNIITQAFGLLALARVLQARGDFAGALRAVEEFETRLEGQTGPFEYAEDQRTLRVRVQLAFGDLQSAARWAEQIQRSEDFRRHPKRYRLTLASICLAQGRFDEAEKILTEIAATAPAGNSLNRRIQTQLLLAAAAAGQGRAPEAMQILETCLDLAEPEGYLQTFIEIGEPVRDLLAAYLRLAAPGHRLYARKILEAFPPSGSAKTAGEQPGGLVEPLSERELEVLQLIALGKTNQEIAGRLVVARGTIKAHAANIFRKLDVDNRTAAVARARDLGILS